jgi:hypothetical protein
VIVLAVVAAVTFTAVYAFTAGITVPTSQAGRGSAATLQPATQVRYTLDTDDPRYISQFEVKFTSNVPPSGATVAARIQSTAALTSCSYNAGTAIATCALSPELKITSTLPDTVRVVVAA